MGRKITVDLSEGSWLILMERQFESKKAGKKLSLSKMVADIVDEKLTPNKKAAQN